MENVNCHVDNDNYVKSVECWMSSDENGNRMMNSKLVLKQDLSNIKNNYNFLMNHFVFV
mgnify:CR=1 FL=1